MRFTESSMAKPESAARSSLTHNPQSHRASEGLEMSST